MLILMNSDAMIALKQILLTLMYYGNTAAVSV